MNKALILLLVIFVQSQSDGILLPKPNTNHHFQDSQLEGWKGGEFPYAEDISEDYKKRSLTNDAFTRRSALDKNFMRFGRGSESPQEHLRQRLYTAGKLVFYRFGRGLKDNFIRFGRGGEKSGFIRFGRTRPEDFFRAGKSLRENFIRFGKSDRNFMRFGREKSDENYQDWLAPEEPFQNLPKPDESSRTQGNFIRFGKSPKNDTDILGFGSRYQEGDDSDEYDEDSASQKEVKRKRRQAEQTPTNLSDRDGSSPFAFFYFLPQNIPRRISPALDGSWQHFEKINTSRLTPFFPVFSNLLKNPHSYGSAAKRDRGGSNFIREPFCASCPVYHAASHIPENLPRDHVYTNRK